MFGKLNDKLKKENKKNIIDAKIEYEKLLKENGFDSKSNNGGFVLGEKKEIYKEGMSLDDIIKDHLYD